MRVLTAALALAIALIGEPASAAAPSDRQGPRQEQVLAMLDQVRVVEEIDYQPGYDRYCDPGACVFGEPWTDDHDGPKGHNGCTTREDVLLAQMKDIEMRWGSDCRIYEARLRDPYTGERMTWRDDGYVIAIDHIYPLARAWHAGAWSWTERRRIAFANDLRKELLAVSARANDDKLASGPGEWLPPWRRSQCTYVWRYLRVALAWGLPLTTADAEAVRRVADARC